MANYPSPSNLLLSHMFVVLVFDLFLHLRRNLGSDLVALEHCVELAYLSL